MILKTAVGTYSPLLAISIAAVVGGCATQPDAQPPQFSSAPVVETVYARDTVIGDLNDVMVWANPADPHYPSQVGETGAQNAANVSPFPNSYGGIVVEFNTTLDASQWLIPEGVCTAAQLAAGTPCSDADRGTYCSTGSDPAKAPFTVVDVDNNSRVLLGSICYDPTSPLYRYPSLTFTVGDTVDTDPSANPFTCQAFGPSGGDANGSAFIPSHHYAIQFNSAIIKNLNGDALVTPTATPWASGAFQFTTSGFDIMAAGYQDQNTGYLTFLSKPYAGYLKDLAAVGAAAYQQPADNTPFYVYTTMDVGNGTITATRADGSSFGANITQLEPRVIEIDPGDTWEPGQKYTVTIGNDLTTADGTITISAGATYNFSAAPGDVSAISVLPASGAVAQLAYGKQGAAIDQPTFVLIDYNAPVDPATATTANVTVKGADGVALAGTVTLNAAANNQEIIFAPTDKYKSSTGTSPSVYTISATGIGVDPTVPNFPAGQKFPDLTSQFTTSTVRTSAFISLDTGKSADRASNQPLTILADGIEVLFSRPIDTSTILVDPNSTTSATPKNINVTELNADGSAGTAVDPSNLIFFDIPVAQGGAPSPFAWILAVDYGDTTTAQDYPVKCNQKYQVAFQTGISDADETPEQTLSAEGCKSGNCQDIRSFTTQPYTVADGSIDFTPASGNTHDTLSVTFNASLDHTIANPLIEAGLIKLVDSNGAAVAITCPDLADDTSTTITCTVNGALNANSTYEAIMIVQTTSPLKIATQAYGLETDQSGNPAPILADQTTCTYAGSIVTPILTACPAATPRHPARKVARTSLVGKKLALR